MGSRAGPRTGDCSLHALEYMYCVSAKPYHFKVLIGIQMAPSVLLMMLDL